MPRPLSEAAFADYFRPGVRVFWPGCAGHSPLFEKWARATPAIASGAHFCGVWVPGINRFDPTALHPLARATTYFLSRELRDGWKRGAIDFVPAQYSEIAPHLSLPGLFDVVLLHVAPPDEHGQCSLSLAADFTATVVNAAERDVKVLAHVNPQLPRTRGPSISVDRIDAWVEDSMPPLFAPREASDPALAAVALRVAEQIRDADTVQIGLGRLPAALLEALNAHRDLRIHSGMVSDGLLALRRAGALACESRERPPVCTGVAIGGEQLYQSVSDAAFCAFASAEYTHAHATLAAIPNLVAVNSALEIDLFGQVNAGSLHGEQVSGVGGLVDFMRGARASKGGRGIVAAPALAGRSRASRIVAQLAPGAVTLARTDADIVVTEHGVAKLRHLGYDARAAALIAIAAPEHQESLSHAWQTLRRSL